MMRVRLGPRDIEELVETLRTSIHGEVRFDRSSQGLYAVDASNYRAAPLGVVVPRDEADVFRALLACRDVGVPVLPRGAGTSLAGQACNVAVVLDFSKYMNQVLELIPERSVARVQPGALLDSLNAHAGRHGLRFGPDPASHAYCTVGGMLGNNACGARSLYSEQAGPGARTEHHVEAMQVVTYDGVSMSVGPTSEHELDATLQAGGRKADVYRKLRDLRDRYANVIRREIPTLPRRVSGFNLQALLPESGFNVAQALVGTEGTCVTILSATLRLSQQLPERALVVLGYPSIFEAADHIATVREWSPLGCQAISEQLVTAAKPKLAHRRHLTALPPGGAWLLVEFGGDEPQAVVARAQAFSEYLSQQSSAPTARVVADPQTGQGLWALAEAGLGVTAMAAGSTDAWPGWEDSAVPPAALPDYLRGLQSLLQRYGYRSALFGHFAQGCVHGRIDFDFQSSAGLELYKSFTREAAELVSHYGGTLSGGHGDGQARGDLLRSMYSRELLEAFNAFKAAWDPDDKMNPGKVVAPKPRDADLRLGLDYHPWQPHHYYAYSQDHGSLAHATLRCVGIGKCRQEEGGTMCPSYMVTREEKHSTRGRAHLLYEMLQGEVITRGWESQEVKEALDLCLACKACKSECPTQVDLATLKSEFMAHYYQEKFRPRQTWAFGLAPWWAHAASVAPRAINALLRAPGTGRLAKWVTGTAPQRVFPNFAPTTFRAWFRRQKPGQGRDVILWPDTFNNYFAPQTLAAAVEVLAHAGCAVRIPEQSLCCGRPFYDYGFLEHAKRGWRAILDALEPDIQAGTPLVGLEPSCVAAFRDELVNLFPDDTRAHRLKAQTYTLSEWLGALDGFEVPQLARRALVHAHCHDEAVLGFDRALELVERMGLDVYKPRSGCCGMAGAFGYERGEKYSVSVAAGERVLLPAVRAMADAALIITDGFSCRDQIRQATDRTALHLAEAMQLALHADAFAGDGRRPEQQHAELTPKGLQVRARGDAKPRAAGWALGAASLGAALWWTLAGL